MNIAPDVDVVDVLFDSNKIKLTPRSHRARRLLKSQIGPNVHKLVGSWSIRPAGESRSLSSVRAVFFDLEDSQRRRVLSFRTQSPEDISRIAQFCPEDQVRTLFVEWSETSNPLTDIANDENADPNRDDYAALPKATHILSIRPDRDEDDQPSPEREARAKVNALNDADLQTLAAERGVKWDKKASRDTMVDRITEAALAATGA